MTGRTPKYLTCPCGYPLSEEVSANKHIYRCIKCGYTREDTR